MVSWYLGRAPIGTKVANNPVCHKTRHMRFGLFAKTHGGGSGSQDRSYDVSGTHWMDFDVPSTSSTSAPSSSFSSSVPSSQVAPMRKGKRWTIVDVMRNIFGHFVSLLQAMRTAFHLRVASQPRLLSILNFISRLNELLTSGAPCVTERFPGVTFTHADRREWICF